MIVYRFHRLEGTRSQNSRARVHSTVQSNLFGAVRARRTEPEASTKASPSALRCWYSAPPSLYFIRDGTPRLEARISNLVKTEHFAENGRYA